MVQARGLARELRALPMVDEVDYKDVAFVLGRPHLRATRRSNPLRRIFLEAPYRVQIPIPKSDPRDQFPDFRDLPKPCPPGMSRPMSCV